MIHNTKSQWRKIWQTVSPPFNSQNFLKAKLAPFCRITLQPGCVMSCYQQPKRTTRHDPGCDACGVLFSEFWLICVEETFEF